MVTLQFIYKYRTHFFFLISGFLLYGNTLSHEFALDDALVITDNTITQKGFDGIWEQMTNDQFMGFYGTKKSLVSGGRYRPLSMVSFCIEYELFGDNPFIYHLLNVLFYILNGILIYVVLKQLFKQFPERKWPFELAFLAAVLWFYHPIHTEVVANVKGRDEMMALCGELMAMWFMIRYLHEKKPLYLVGLFLSFLFALFSKENAVTWLAIYPLTVFIFYKKHLRTAVTPITLILVAIIAWGSVRREVVGISIESVADNLMNDPFLDASRSEKYATIVYTLGKYLQLLVYPHPLTFDYYPKHIPIVNWSEPSVLLSLFTYIGILVTAVVGMIRRNIYAFGIGIFAITLSIASNLVFSIGAFMNERFIFVSTLGFCIILAYIMLYELPKLIKNRKRYQQILTYGIGVVLILYSIKTISRNPVWKNNMTLATHDANVSVNGAKSNVMAGGLLLEEAQASNNPQEKQQLLQQSQVHLTRAVNIYPEYLDALLLMGNLQFELNRPNARTAISYYQRILAINQTHKDAWRNVDIVLNAEPDKDYVIQTYSTLLAYYPNRAKTYEELGRLFGQHKQDLKRSIQHLEVGLSIEPNNINILKNLGTAFGMTSEYDKAINVLSKAATLAPNDAMLHTNLALSYYLNGQTEMAKQHFDKAAALDPNIDRSQFPI